MWNMSLLSKIVVDLLFIEVFLGLGNVVQFFHDPHCTIFIPLYKKEKVGTQKLPLVVFSSSPWHSLQSITYYFSSF